jgi:hypothetical protein
LHHLAPEKNKQSFFSQNGLDRFGQHWNTLDRLAPRGRVTASLPPCGKGQGAMARSGSTAPRANPVQRFNQYFKDQPPVYHGIENG